MSAKRETYKDKLFYLYNNVTMYVVYNYFECVLKIDFMGSLEAFLNYDFHCHKLFHMYLPLMSCCQCGGSGSLTTDFRNLGRLDKNEFEHLYKQNKDFTPEHDEKKGQQCICQYSAKSSIEISDLDITLIHKILRTFFTFPPTPGNPQSIKVIKEIRDKLFHHGDSITSQLFVQFFDQLGEATKNLASDVSRMYFKETSKRIADIKTKYSVKEEFMDTMQMCNVDLERNILKAFEQLDCRIADKLLFRLNLSFNQLDKEPDEVETTNDSPENNEDEKICFINWTFKNRGSWNVEKATEKLRQVSAILDFKILFVYAGSLVVKTTTKMSLLTNADDFYNSVRSFLQQFVKECDIDTTDNQEFEVLVDIIYVPIKDRGEEVCKSCRHKDEILLKKESKIERLKKDLKKQMKLSYSSLFFEVDSLSKSLFKDLKDDPIEQLLAEYEDENIWRKFSDPKTEKISNEIKIPSESSVTQQLKQVGDMGDDSLQAEDIESCSRNHSKDYFKDDPIERLLADDENIWRNFSDPKSEMLSSKREVTVQNEVDVGVQEGSNERQDKEQSIRDIGENIRLANLTEKPRFVPIKGLTFRFSENLTVNSLALTNNDKLLVSFTESKLVLLFSDIGESLDSCSLEDFPWDICVCPRPSTSVSPSDYYQDRERNETYDENDKDEEQEEEDKDGEDEPEDVIITLPGKHCYQHVYVNNDKMLSKHIVPVGMYCPAVTVDTKYIYIGSENVICMYTREDDIVRTIETDCSILRMAFTGESCHEITDEYQFPATHFVLLNNKREFYIDAVFNSEKYIGGWISVKNEKLKQENICDVQFDKNSAIKLVLSNSENCIYAFFSDGKIRNIFDNVCGVSDPTAFCVNENIKKVFVANKSGREIIVYVQRIFD